MDIIHTPALWIHIIAGHIALLSGSIIMIMKKGDGRHKRYGTAFYYSMLAVSITSILLSVITDSRFLLHVGIFAFFLNHGGWRSSRDRSLRPSLTDLLVLLAATVNAVFMLMTGHIILMVFGGITVYLFLSDLWLYRLIFMKKEQVGNRWLARHIGMMGGAYISAFTAFLTVNIHFDGPAWIIWLTPTFVIVPLMQYWTWRFTRRKSFSRS